MVSVLTVYSHLDDPLIQSTDLFSALLLLLVLMLPFHFTLNATLSLKQDLNSKYGVDAITSGMPNVGGDVLVLKLREFVTTGRSFDTSKTQLIPRHVLPNVISLILFSRKLSIAEANITISALSFLDFDFPKDFPT